METQAQAPAQAQVQTPVHPIHEETATIGALTQWVSANEDNDPNEGTADEAPKTAKAEEAPQEEAQVTAAEAEETVEFDEESPVFEIEYKTEKGKEQKKLSLKELREGYLAKQDYHRNIQKVKQQEAELVQKAEEARTQAAAEYVQKLELQKQAVTKLAGVKSMAEIEQLAASDPATAQQEFLKAINVNQTLQALENEQRAAAQQLQMQQQNHIRTAANQALQVLQEKIPDWSPDKYQAILKTSVDEYGFDASQIVHPGLLQAIHDASQFRSLQKAKPETLKKVAAIPKVLRPGSADKPNPKTEATQEAEKQFRKTGDRDSFMRLYLQKQKQKG
jgi:hypothetical protein